MNKFTPPKIETLNIEVPVSEPNDDHRFEFTRFDSGNAELTELQQCGLKRLLQGATNAGLKLENGKSADRKSLAIRWLLEQIGQKGKEG